MDTYTIDSVTILRYAVGALPTRVQNVLSRSGAGTAELQVPAIVASETTYMADRNQSINGQTLSMDASDVVDVIRRQMNAKIVETTRDELAEIPPLIDTWASQMHDAMVVASHLARDTDAIVTTDGKIQDHHSTLWD